MPAKQTGKKKTKKQYEAEVKAYLESLTEDRREVMKKLRKMVLDNLPEGFTEIVENNGFGYVVPHSLYPDGYHCTPETPLPFMNIASRKTAVALYHMGVYADQKLCDWFTKEYPKHCSRKLDMGKSCIRFKKLDDIPYELLGKLVTKVSVEKWIKTYEKTLKK